jgi:hypothetical protein
LKALRKFFDGNSILLILAMVTNPFNYLNHYFAFHHIELQQIPNFQIKIISYLRRNEHMLQEGLLLGAIIGLTFSCIVLPK